MAYSPDRIQPDHDFGFKRPTPDQPDEQLSERDRSIREERGLIEAADEGMGRLLPHEIRLGYALQAKRKAERAEARRANGIAFGHSFGRVANGVQSIRDVTNFIRKFRHLSNTTGVIRYRTIRIKGNNHASQSQHGRGSNGNAEQASL